jgi:hypothetical protein
LEVGTGACDAPTPTTTTEFGFIQQAIQWQICICLEFSGIERVGPIGGEFGVKMYLLRKFGDQIVIDSLWANSIWT